VEFCRPNQYRWLTAQRYYFRKPKTWFRESRKDTKVICPILRAYDICVQSLYNSPNIFLSANLSPDPVLYFSLLGLTCQSSSASDSISSIVSQRCINLSDDDNDERKHETVCQLRCRISNSCNAIVRTRFC